MNTNINKTVRTYTFLIKKNINCTYSYMWKYTRQNNRDTTLSPKACSNLSSKPLYPHHKYFLFHEHV